MNKWSGFLLTIDSPVKKNIVLNHIDLTRKISQIIFEVKICEFVKLYHLCRQEKNFDVQWASEVHLQAPLALAYDNDMADNLFDTDFDTLVGHIVGHNDDSHILDPFCIV